MPLDQLGQFALPVRDIERSSAFYEQALGLEKLFSFPGLAFFDCAGVRLMLEADEGANTSNQGGVCHYFKVQDIAASVDELSLRGVRFTDTPHLIATMPDHELWMVFFKDPDGHQLALMEERTLRD